MAPENHEHPEVEQITNLVNSPESASLAFESGLGDPGRAAELIAAIANSGGGRIVFGVEKPGSLVGLDDPAAATRMVEEAASEVLPAVAVTVQDKDVEGQTVSVVSVPSGTGPVLPPKGPIVKRDAAGQSEAVSAKDVTQAFARTSKPGKDAIAELIRRVTELNESSVAADKRAAEAEKRLSDEIKKGPTFGSQVPAILISGIVGAVLGVALTAFLGL